MNRKRLLTFLFLAAASVIFVVFMILINKAEIMERTTEPCGTHTDIYLYDIKSTDQKNAFIRFPSESCDFLPVLYCSGRGQDLSYGCVEISGEALEKVKILLNR